MNPPKVFEESIHGVKRIVCELFFDERGFFCETYQKPRYEAFGIDTSFVQDNYSFSRQGVIRGLHFQSGPGQAKLVSVIEGEIFDVFVDLRKDSPSYGKWASAVLSGDNHTQIFIPSGCAHGFAVLSKQAKVTYKVSSIYDPSLEKTIRYDDSDLGIQWPITNPILSQKDKSAPTFYELFGEEINRS